MRTLTTIFVISNIATSMAFGQAAFGQNRDSNTRIFNEPAAGGWTQIFLGLGDIILAQTVRPGSTVAQKVVYGGREDLTYAKDLPLSEEQRAKTIEAILQNRANFTFESDVGNETEINEVAARRLEKVRSAEIVTFEQKQAVVAQAENSLASARAQAIELAKNDGIIPNTVRVIRYTGASLLILDMAGRIYVWNALDANPTFSPAAQVLIHVFNNNK